ncbi:MAG: hypothetical protein GX322_07645 [Firmicutes bacterium]|nr:hypothetical protein [Bacillota bacterium]
MSAPRDTVGYRQMNEVVAYSDDLHVWVYYDQTDDALRYEAYVVDYNHRGEPSTLAFVIDEGVLSWESALGQHFIANDLRASGAKQSLWTIPRHTKATLVRAEFNLYLQLSEEDIHSLHRLFAREERRLKRRNRTRWTKRLHALGYDVIPSAY